MEVPEKNVLKFLVSSKEDLDKHVGYDLDNRKRSEKWSEEMDQAFCASVAITCVSQLIMVGFYCWSFCMCAGHDLSILALNTTAKAQEYLDICLLNE